VQAITGIHLAKYRQSCAACNLQQALLFLLVRKRLCTVSKAQIV